MLGNKYFDVDTNDFDHRESFKDTPGKIQVGLPRARNLNNKSGKRDGKGVIPRTMTLNDNKIDYVHWDDLNELVDRLRLLEASRQTGHNAHDNEILLIIEELREADFIIN
ncbi:hypothetical protein G5I_02097 [Acromyrmex echinatior]|uniref:Uncharacterized protein n=1 Tax=Acromyrmex echinatior TaxID=103372 RepID=F4W9E5_ACREC|nr:hypothetical protein G5I_02097 [Acromyrmex echinatior]